MALAKGTVMQRPTIDQFLKAAAPAMPKSPTALIFAEDHVEIASTLDHAIKLGFGTVALFADPEAPLPERLAPQVHRIDWDGFAPNALQNAVNSVIAAAPGAWLHYCYNGEYLYFPFCETRAIRDLTTFMSEERRSSVLTYVIDLYAADLERNPNAVALHEAWLDQTGYYALGRSDPITGHSKERQLDFFGGLRWRFEEHVPPNKRRIDRIGLFRAEAGLELLEDHRLNLEEFNTYACAWHHNATAAICSFRTAKALRSNPGSRQSISSFKWSRSTRFGWHSQQLMELGLMEPGQWF